MADPTLGLRVDPAAETPQYQQIFDAVVDRIRTGAFPAGFRLPPSRKLAQALGTHRNTVVRAYQDLEGAGFVHGVVGRGTFVSEGATINAGPLEDAPEGAIPWASLLSDAAVSEPLSRFDNLRTAPPPGAINLSRMEPDPSLLPVDLLQRCMDHVLRARGARALGYAPREGLHRLRLRVAEDLARLGVPASADDLVITTGSQQALDLVARALITPGEAILVDEMTYTGALNLLALAGARLVPVPRDDEGPELAALERLAHVGPRALYVMPGCHNPTTAVMSDARREAIVDWSRRHGIPLIEDDYASDLNLDDEPLPTPLRARSGDVLYMGTYSKKLMPSLRVGYLLCPRRLKPALLPMKHALDLGTSLLLQHALAELLDRGYLAPHLEKVRTEYRRRRDALADTLDRDLPAGWTFDLPRTGVGIWLPLRDGVRPDTLYQAARERGVLISPSTYNVVDGEAAPGVRVMFCAEPLERVVEGAHRLCLAIDSLASARPRRAEIDESVGVI